MPKLTQKSRQPFYLLASGKSNSLAASLEILNYLRQHGKQGENLHGSPQYVNTRIQMLCNIQSAVLQLHGCRLGIIGKPSDWLISSDTDTEAVRQKLGIQLIQIQVQELMELWSATPEPKPPGT